MTERVEHAVVIGAGVGGLATALALSRAGHRVTILERDATPEPADPDAAFAWDRRGAPQVRHSHALLARLRNLLRDRYPDVLSALLDAGATEIRFCEMLPPEMADREPRDGDDDLVALACRRTTFEWVLRRIVLADPGVSLRDGVAVEGLATRAGDEATDAARTTGAARDPIGVTGVRLRHGDGIETIDADVVVAAVGRRSGVPAWLHALGVDLDAREEDTGIIYLSRFYRLHDGVAMPEQIGPIGGDLGYLKYAVFQGDNRTYSVTFAVPTGDATLRARLLDPTTFDHAARVLPATTAWAEAELAEPITPVHVMGGLVNRRIRYLATDGAPRVLGFHAVGDAHTCTNPLYGRGCSLAMVQATLLADALAEHADDAHARATAYEAASAREIEPWYRAAVAQDRFSRELAARELGSTDASSAAVPDADRAGDAPGGDAHADAGADARAGHDGDRSGATDADEPDAAPAPAAIDDEVPDQPPFVEELMREGLLPAVRTDPVVFRAFLRAFNLLVAPDALLADSEVIGRVLAVYQDRENRPADPVPGPSRAEMLDELATVVA